MLNIKDHKTINMFDPFVFLGPKRRKMLDESWAGIFRDHVRHILPVDLLALHFSAGMGRPTSELVAMMGAMLLQHMARPLPFMLIFTSTSVRRCVNRLLVNCTP